ncbi:MAG: hypothetical protein MJ106_07400 [Lentisphaeria bacterium]|nr:hypothetical protein [Lentisphaeria bacterium]
MADELQALLDRLDKEGVQKGEAEKARLIAEGEAEAKTILENAKAQASAMVAQAESECAMMRQKSEEALRQSGRQVLLQVRQELEGRVQKAVASMLKAELKPGVVGQIIGQICIGYLKDNGVTDDISVLVPADSLSALEDAVKASLAEQLRERVSLKPDKRLTGGFKLSFSGSQVVYDFSDEALAEAIAAHLSPALGAIITA